MKRLLLNDMDVALFVKENWKIEVQAFQIIPGYMQDEKKSKPRLPVWRVMLDGADLYAGMIQEPGLVVLDDEFYPQDLNTGYILPREKGYVYLAESTQFKRIYRSGVRAGISYYDLNTDVPGR